METRCGRSDSSGILRVDCLISHHVLIVAVPIEIRRNRNASAAMHVDVILKFNRPLTSRRHAHDNSMDAVDRDARTEPHFSTGLHQAAPSPIFKAFQEQELDPAVIGESSRRNYARVV